MKEHVEKGKSDVVNEVVRIKSTVSCSWIWINIEKTKLDK